MAIEALTYADGSPHSPYFGRIELELLSNEQFAASYQHRALKSEWRGKLAAGTFAKACAALASSGFPNVPPLGDLVPGEHPLSLGWLSDGAWQRAKVKENASGFSKIIIVASSILSVLDSRLARMPPGETTPVIEHHLVEVPG